MKNPNTSSINRPSLNGDPDKEMMTAAEKWVANFLDKHVGIGYNDTCTYRGKPGQLGSVLNRLILNNHDLNLKFPQGVIDASLEEYLNRKKEEIKMRVFKAVKFVTPNDELNRWVKALTGKEDPLDILVMQHFIWQVKRKMLDKDVERHMMPILVGRTGSGKSVAVHKLLGPVIQLSEMGKDLGIFGDDREWAVFHKYYVIFFDEMSKARKVDVEALKNTITAKDKA
jgi:hypothetical protein